MSKRYQLLAICDDPGLLNLIRAIFPSQGYDVLAAKDIPEGTAHLKKQRPTLILIHLEAQKGKGLAFCNALRKLPPLRYTPILLLADGPDDYLRKPFGLDALAAKIRKLTWDAEAREKGEIMDSRQMDFAVEAEDDLVFTVQKSATGIKAFDELTRGGLPKGSNVMLIGKVGCGKSHFCRSFVKSGLQESEPCVYVALDDAPFLIRRELTTALSVPLEEYTEKRKLYAMVDAYNWGGGQYDENEAFALRGSMNLTKLGGLIHDACASLGQDAQSKAGGRRVIDSITSVAVNFELAHLQHFLFQITRSSIAFGYATSLFTLEAGTVDERMLNNLTYVMDGVIEIESREDGKYLRITHMKWIEFDHNWIKFSN